MNPFQASQGDRLSRRSVLVAACLLLMPATLFADGATVIAAGPLPIAVVEAIPVALDAIAKQKLIAAGSYSSFFQDQPKVDLCPNPGAAASITHALGDTHPNIGVQTLVVAAMPARLASRADRNLMLYNLLHQFRTMEGIQYFSATHGKIRTLFTASHVVRDPASRVMIGDPRYLAMEPVHEL